MPEQYESNWCVINDTLFSSHKNSIKFIYFDKTGSLKKLIIFDTKCVFFDTLFDSYSSGKMTLILSV